MKFVTELVGTFFLVLTVGMTVLSPQDAGAFAPLAIGFVLAVMIYAGGHISGGHYNPAVSWGVFLRGKLNAVDLLGYWVAQVIGAAIAAFTVIYFKGTMANEPMVLDVPKVLLAEFIFTFALVHVVLQVATSKQTVGNSYFGLAIGLVLVVGAYSVGPISGGAFNPSVALGAALMNLLSFRYLWVYVLANLLGASAAALFFKFSEPKD